VTSLLSPLRYPGGKARLAPYLARLLASQAQEIKHYVEPFAGGAGAALTLLVDGAVERVTINDLNPGIAALWRCVFYQTDQFARLIEKADISVEHWHRHRTVYLQPHSASDLDLGFATFFLNRCNRSGILGARPIGGLEQTGKWKMDARFNRTRLSDLVKMLGRHRSKVVIEELDVMELFDAFSDYGSCLMYLDPPYLEKGSGLYLDAMTLEEHADLANVLRGADFPWVMTYDRQDDYLRDLYRGHKCLAFQIAHTAQYQHVGSELMIFSDVVMVSDTDVLPRSSARWLVH